MSVQLKPQDNETSAVIIEPSVLVDAINKLTRTGELVAEAGGLIRETQNILGTELSTFGERMLLQGLLTSLEKVDVDAVTRIFRNLQANLGGQG